MLTKEKILKGERKNSFSFLKTFFDMDHFKILYWICYNIAFVLFFCFLSTMHVESQLPNQGSNPCYLHWKAKSSTGLPGKSWKLIFFLSSSSYFFFFLYCLRTMTEYRGAVYNFNMDFHPERSRRKFEGKLSLYNESFYSCYILLVFYFLWHGSRYFKKEHVYNRQNYARELWKHKNLSHKAYCTEKKNTILCGWHVLFSPPTHFWAY